MSKQKCTSRPNCSCDFCERSRSEPSARDEQDQLALDYIDALETEYIGESLREWWIAGQRKDARLAMAEWFHAVREYRKVQ
jgi:hypothetical protein